MKITDAGVENLHTPCSLRTVSGKYVNVFEPDPDTLDINDIAHALAHQPRFGGHLPKFFSVAQHSFLCSLEAPHNKELAFDLLMHDASEAYLIDLPRPIKVKILQYKEIEDNLMGVLAKKFGFNWPMSGQVKVIDNWQLEREWNDLMLNREVTSYRITPWAPQDAKEVFLNEFNRLCQR